MKVLLVDIDSTIPNLALMKLSAWHKAKGDEVGFNITEPDRIYASVVFKKNQHLVDGLKAFYPEAEIIVGGSGLSLVVWLPNRVEAMCPDYELYPNIDYSLGFTSRGCVRKCYFCVVPEKEGKYQRWHHPEAWVRHKKAKLLDNNWYADRDWFFETSEWFIKNDIAIDVTQGMDIRLITPEIARQLKRLKWFAPLHFAYDDENYGQKVLDGIQIMKDEGMTKWLRNKTMFLVYCHDDTQYESALRRCNVLKDAGTTAFVMFNMDNARTQRIKDLQHWANRPWLYWSMGFEDYKRSKSGGWVPLPPPREDMIAQTPLLGRGR